jgi:energy-coupling factor transporter ATP-binding protein EcfA2
MMKNLQSLGILIVFFLGINSSFSQNSNTQPVVKPSEGKSMVYITRSGGAMLMNFRVYDKDLFIGSLEYGSYFLYECEPGQHLFWAASENRDFVTANLEANKVYVIDLEARMGAFIAAVAVVPQNPNEKRDRKKFYRTVKKELSISKFQANLTSEDKESNIKEALEKFEDLKKKNSSKIMILNPEMNFENADKPHKIL